MYSQPVVNCRQKRKKEKKKRRTQLEVAQKWGKVT
jgi:hypothetical protein